MSPELKHWTAISHLLTYRYFYFIPGTVLDTKRTMMGKTEVVLAPMKCTIVKLINKITINVSLYLMLISGVM